MKLTKSFLFRHRILFSIMLLQHLASTSPAGCISLENEILFDFKRCQSIRAMIYDAWDFLYQATAIWQLDLSLGLAFLWSPVIDAPDRPDEFQSFRVSMSQRCLADSCVDTGHCIRCKMRPFSPRCRPRPTTNVIKAHLPINFSVTRGNLHKCIFFAFSIHAKKSSCFVAAAAAPARHH